MYNLLAVIVIDEPVLTKSSFNKNKLDKNIF